VRWKIAGRLAAGSVPASAICLIILLRFDLSGAGSVITTTLRAFFTYGLFAAARSCPQESVSSASQHGLRIVLR
jgi:hypothetical protein